MGVANEMSPSLVLTSWCDFLRVMVAHCSVLFPDCDVRLRIKGLCEEPRALATAISFPWSPSLWSRLPAAPPGGVDAELNHEREAISFLLLCCLSSYANWKRGENDAEIVKDFRHFQSETVNNSLYAF